MIVVDDDPHVPLVPRPHPEAEPIHVADDEPGQEGAQVAAAARRVDREVADRDDSDDRDRRRLTPYTGPAIGDNQREEDAEADSECRRNPEVLDEVDCRIGDGRVSAQHDTGEDEGEDGAGRVVQRRFGDRGLLDLLPNADAVEERDENCRIGRCQHRADQETRRERQVEREGRNRARDERGYDDTRDRQQPEPH